MRTAFLIALFTLAAGTTQAQLTGYTSFSYGYATNPLYNYQQLSDQVHQTFLQLSSEHDFDYSTLKFDYVGGSMLFNRNALRNYYEHRLVGNLDVRFSSKPEPSDGNDDDSLKTLPQNTNLEGATNPIPEDSSDVFLHTDIAFGARHDRTAYQEFDNVGTAWKSSLRLKASDDAVIRILNTTEYRQYQNLSAYTNLSEILTLQAGNNFTAPVRYGVSMSGGVKYFPNMFYDTSVFQEKRTYTYQSYMDSTLVGMGNQQHWQRFTVLDSTESDKLLLTDPKTKTAFQLQFEAFVRKAWKSSTLTIEALYSVNTHSDLFSMIQNVRSSTLNEDLYNTMFGYVGPEFHLDYTVQLPSKVQCAFAFDLLRWTYSVPAYDLRTGNVLHDHREDFRSSLEFILTRFFEVHDGVGFDVSLELSGIRNQSNDPFNDFSFWSLSTGIGFGF